MKRNTLPAWGLALLLLVVGGLIGLALQPNETTVEDGFRTWFWQQRPLDLLAQVGMIFAGALGAAALLPHRREPGGVLPSRPTPDAAHDAPVPEWDHPP